MKDARPHSIYRRLRPVALFVLALLAVLALLYWRVPGLGYYFDDAKIVLASHRTFTELFSLPGQPGNPIPAFYYRPLAFVLYWAIYHVGMESPVVHHLTPGLPPHCSGTGYLSTPDNGIALKPLAVFRNRTAAFLPVREFFWIALSAIVLPYSSHHSIHSSGQECSPFCPCGKPYMVSLVV